MINDRDQGHTSLSAGSNYQDSPQQFLGRKEGEKKEISVNSDLFSCVVLIKQLKHDYMQLIKRMT